MLRHLMAGAVAGMLAVSVTQVGAQTADTAGVVTSWSPYLGCWSTSSGGVIGPMVCVVPTEDRARVEFMTVDGDTVIARTFVDASGKRVSALRPGCTGWETGKWSGDGQRLLMHAEFRCKDSPTQRSDAILSLSHADAFTHVERNLVRDDAPARVVTFIVQLDTTVFPAEVRRRLPHLRPLAIETAELETLAELSPASVVEAASELDPTVVETWLADRGEISTQTATMVRMLHVAALGRELPQPRVRSRTRVMSGLNRFGNVGTFASSNRVYLTADHGLWSQFVGGIGGYWNLNGPDPRQPIGVPFRWP